LLDFFRRNQNSRKWLRRQAAIMELSYHQENYCVKVFSFLGLSDNFLSLTATTFSATTQGEKNRLSDKK
jgi:hypothetical protein